MLMFVLFGYKMSADDNKHVFPYYYTHISSNKKQLMHNVFCQIVMKCMVMSVTYRYAFITVQCNTWN